MAIDFGMNKNSLELLHVVLPSMTLSLMTILKEQSFKKLEFFSFVKVERQSSYLVGMGSSEMAFGLYYHLPKRAAGIRYVFIGKPMIQRPSYVFSVLKGFEEQVTVEYLQTTTPSIPTCFIFIFPTSITSPTAPAQVAVSEISFRF
uniref:Uncharacterized protein n=1 Tax=Oryza nivara TaxID=4536 RepID=A0A0E0HQI6_ORYNI